VRIDMQERIRALLYGAIDVPGSRLGMLRTAAAGKGR
jgi:hypothetical protein